MDFEFAPDHNVVPTSRGPIIWLDGWKRLTVARCGLIPTWAKDIGYGVRMFNARIEWAAEKSSFRGARPLWALNGQIPQRWSGRGWLTGV